MAKLALTSTKSRCDYLPQLDGLRGIAVLLVLLAHAAPTTDLPVTLPFWRAVAVLRTGYVGVDLFFVLSGFLITRLLLAERIRTGRIDMAGFYVRRVLRIFPIYYLAILVVTLVWPAGAGLQVSLLVYGFNYVLPFSPAPYPLEHVWSLAVEEQFYLVWPIIILLVPVARLRRLILIGAPVLAVGTAILLAATLPPALAGELIYTALPTRALSLLLGSYLAVREMAGEPLRPPILVAALLAGGAVLLAAVAGRAEHLVPGAGWYWCLALIGYSGLAFGCVGLATSAAVPAWLRTPLTWSPLRAVGRISYGLYLYHLPILYAFGLNQAAVGQGGVRAGSLIGAYALAFVVATLSFVLIERPLMRQTGRLRAWVRRLLPLRA